MFGVIVLCVALSGCSGDSRTDDRESPTFEEAASKICDAYGRKIEGVAAAQQNGSLAEELRVALDAGVAETRALARLVAPSDSSEVFRRLIARHQSRDSLLQVMVVFADDPSPKAFNTGLPQWAKLNREISELAARAELDSCSESSLKIERRAE